MRYRLVISEEALTPLRTLPREQRQRVGQKLDALQTGLQGNVKKLAGQPANIACVSALFGSYSHWKTT